MFLQLVGVFFFCKICHVIVPELSSNGAFFRLLLKHGWCEEISTKTQQTMHTAFKRPYLRSYLTFYSECMPRIRTPQSKINYLLKYKRPRHK